MAQGTKGIGGRKNGTSGHAPRSPRFKFMQRLEADKAKPKTKPPRMAKTVAEVKSLIQKHKDAKPRLRQSHVFARDVDDFYVEPTWCSERLFEEVWFGPPGARVLDPGCGWGRILRAATDAGYTPIGGDIVDRLQRRELGLQGVAFQRRDFLTGPVLKNITSVTTNPPYKGGQFQRFCERACETASHRVAILCRLGADRRQRTLAQAPATGPHLFAHAAAFAADRRIHHERRICRRWRARPLLVGL
jgi:hypothetical protein